MWRYLAAAGAAVMLAGAGLYWWSGSLPEPPALAAAPTTNAGAENGDATMPPVAEEKSREAKRFARYDRDQDARVSRAEYLASRVKAFERLDTNGDGKLGFEEWAKRTTDKFESADADRSGALDAKEFATTKPVRRSARRAPDCPPARPDGDEG